MLMGFVWGLASIGAFVVLRHLLRYLLREVPAAIKASGVKRLYFGAEFHGNEKSSRQLQD